MDIVCLGEPLLEFSQSREEGRTVYLQGYGGDTSNCAVAPIPSRAQVDVVMGGTG